MPMPIWQIIEGSDSEASTVMKAGLPLLRLTLTPRASKERMGDMVEEVVAEVVEVTAVVAAAGMDLMVQQDEEKLGMMQHLW